MTIQEKRIKNVDPIILYLEGIVASKSMLKRTREKKGAEVNRGLKDM
jgi:hypothetical protein